MAMNGEHEEYDRFILDTLAIQKEDLKGKESQGEYFTRMRETTAVVNDIIKKYTDKVGKISGQEPQDFLLRITNRRTNEKPSLVASLVRSAFECAAPGADWKQHAELMAAVEMQANAYYFVNWVYDDKFLSNSADTKRSVNAAMRTKPLAEELILDWAEKSNKHKSMLMDVLRLFSNSDFYTETAQYMDIFENVYDKQKDKPIPEQISYAMERTELLAQYYKNAVRLGGALAKISPEQTHALEEFGRNFGIAGQIANDIADYTVVQYETFAKQYKDSFSDFKNKKMTLPLIFALAQAQGRNKSALKEMLEQDTIKITDTDEAEVYNIMTDCGAFDTSRKYAVKHANFAKSALRQCFDKNARKFLSQATIMPRYNKYYALNE